MEKLYVSHEGLEKLKAELAQCKERTLVVAAAIEHARSLGDLRENADYHASKDEQAMLHARIRDLQDKIARSEVLDDSAMDTSRVYVGATVKVRNKKTNRENVYQLVSPVETDIANGKISVRSPVGQALVGKSVGDTVVAKVPAGDIEMEILDISR
jgi:transcription elongation factor GreA